MEVRTSREEAKIIGVHLRECRKRAGLSQVAVGKAIGKPSWYLCKLELGLWTPPWGLTLRIQAVLPDFDPLLALRTADEAAA